MAGPDMARSWVAIPLDLHRLSDGQLADERLVEVGANAEILEVSQLHQQVTLLNKVGTRDVDAVDGSGDGCVRRCFGFHIAGGGKAGFGVGEAGLGAGHIDGGVAAVGALLSGIEAGFGGVEAFLGCHNLAG